VGGRRVGRGGKDRGGTVVIGFEFDFFECCFVVA